MTFVQVGDNVVTRPGEVKPAYRNFKGRVVGYYDNRDDELLVSEHRAGLFGALRGYDTAVVFPRDALRLDPERPVWHVTLDQYDKLQKALTEARERGERYFHDSRIVEVAVEAGIVQPATSGSMALDLATVAKVARCLPDVTTDELRRALKSAGVTVA